MVVVHSSIVRCSSEEDCWTFQYKEIPSGNCILIHKDFAADNGLTFVTSAHNSIYKKSLRINFFSLAKKNYTNKLMFKLILFVFSVIQIDTNLIFFHLKVN